MSLRVEFACIPYRNKLFDTHNVVYLARALPLSAGGIVTMRLEYVAMSSFL